MTKQEVLNRVVYSDGKDVDTFTNDINQRLTEGWRLTHLSNTPFAAAKDVNAMFVTAIFEKEVAVKQPVNPNPLASLTPEQVAAVQAAANLSKMQTVGNQDQPNFNFADLFNIQQGAN